MQRKKNIQLLILLVTLVLATVLLLVVSGTETSSSVDQSLFQIANLDKIDQVILESSQGKTELKFDGIKWRVNGKYEADNQMITILFATLKQTVAKRAVAAHRQDSLQKEIAKNGVRISCFEGGVLAREFNAIGNAAKTETYFQANGEKPYVVAIPGYRVFIASIFELPANDWRNKQVFNFNWQNIKSLEVNLENPKESFKASFTGKFFSIEGVATDTTKLDQFMDALLQLRVETILDSMRAKKYDSLVATKPMLNIILHDVANRSYPLAVFPFEKRSDFLVGKINTEVVLLNPFALKKIFRKKEYFIQR
jgi:hypothetical protein